MDLIEFKILTIFFIIVAGVSGGLFPIRKKLSSAGYERLSIGNAFAGGIFLGAGLLHMLADSIENFNSLNINIDYPFASLIAGIGFVFVLFLEKVLVRSKALHALNEEKNVYPYILFLVLAIHSIIAGMSLGLETNLVSGMVIFIAIIAHKGSASFALGVSLMKANIKKPIIIKTILFFSIMTPIGLILGSIISDIDSNRTTIWFEAIFDALAAGTFVYIAVLDIINEVFEKAKNRWLKFGFLIIGFSLMAIIAIWT
ncbi:MAG: hypothetical protein GQ527_04450 [Bacteroidales bacterium]|nr:hypothetical protein [Bacteroidales bacterium]